MLADRVRIGTMSKADWEQVGSILNSTIRNIVKVNDVHVAFVDSKGTIVSYDDGKSWSSLQTKSNLRRVMSVNNVLVGSGMSGYDFLISTDYGATWSTKYTPYEEPIEYGSYRWAHLSSIDNTIITNIHDWSREGYISYSTDLGDSWTEVVINNDSDMNIYNAQGVLFGVSTGNLTRSLNKGVSWSTPVSSPLEMYGKLIGTNGVILATNSSKNLLRSVDLGVSWSAPSSFVIKSYNDITAVNGVFVAVRADGELIKSIDGGLTWEIMSKPLLPTGYTIGSIASSDDWLIVGANKAMDNTLLFRITV